jgi:Tfp pilus assembly protein PilV
MTAIEVVVSLVILSTVLLGIAATTSTAAKSLTSGQRQVENSAAIQYQAEVLLSVPFDSLVNGTAKVQDIPFRWTVTGTNPKSVQLVATVTNGFGDVVPDTVTLVRTDPDQ